MLSYTFSRREKTLILILAIIVVAIAWYMLVFQSTSDRLMAIQGEQATVEEESVRASAQVAQMNYMQDIIDQRKAEGATPTPIPYYDNVKPLMAHLDAVMSVTDAYELNFEELDAESSQYVRRPVTINFTCGSYAAAERVVESLAAGPYPCVVDAVSITESGSSLSGVSSRSQNRAGSSEFAGSVHVVFFEKNDGTFVFPEEEELSAEAGAAA